MFAGGNSEVALVGKDFATDKSPSPGCRRKSGGKPAFGGLGKTGTDQEVARRHETWDKYIRIDIIVVSFGKLSLEGHQSAGIPVFRYLVSVGRRQIDFVIRFFGAVRFGFIQTDTVHNFV